jgi:hypothetical protein
MNTPFCRIGASVFLLLMFLTGETAGQVGPTSGTGAAPQSATANFFFAEPNELTIKVSVLGAVTRPGRYEISRKIDLLNVLSLAGGTMPDADLEDVRIIRTFRQEGESERREIRLDLEKTSELFQLDLSLQEGDFIYISQSSGITFQEILSVASTTAILALTVVTLINLLDQENTTTSTAPAN